MNKKMTLSLAWILAMSLWAYAIPSMADSNANRRAVTVGIDQAIFPFSDKDADSGLEVEVIRAALESQNLQTRFLYLSNARVDKEFANKHIDIHTAAVPGPEYGKAFLSRFPITAFKNEVIYLKAKNLKLNSIADLSGLRVMAWQGASEFLGPQYAQMAKTNSRYSESPIMPAIMLKMDRVDVFVSQPDIFRANLLQAIPKSEASTALSEVGYADLLPSAMRYWYAFQDPKLRDAYENGLKKIYQTGQMETLLKKYHDEFGTSRGYFIELDCRFLKNRPRCPL
jgi:polar amino acid transport system substrate-binding protein